MEEHTHTFAPGAWPFGEDAVNTAAFTTIQVLHHGFPILAVSHDEDGDWQFLCGTTTETEDCLVICMGCAFQLDPTVGRIADLPLGWQAIRDSATGAWERIGPDLTPPGTLLS